jgi:hypothetical protein
MEAAIRDQAARAWLDGGGSWLAGDPPMIGKVVHGSHAGGLLRYLYGPGRANEHIDPHLIAGFGDPAELEPECRLDGTPDLRRLAGLLAQPLQRLKS